MAGKPKSRVLRTKNVIGILAGLSAFGLLCCFLPPFRIVPLDKAQATRAKATFQPREFAATFWTAKLQTTLEGATDAETLLALIRSDPATARDTHGRTAELGNTYYYFVRGTGRVIQIGDDDVTVSLAARDGRFTPDVIMITANVFGNAIRNATGLLDVNQFANSQDFNNLSHELNMIAESTVLSPFRKAVSPGVRVEFVGCAEIEDEDRDLDPLRIIPVHLQITQAPESPGVER